ncbi:MAG: hypothetical protein KME11_04935 [Timaviella obliquedivisa GSE-PSE-MK23-08B]|jgi:hypothetical protein|nr:hypothetical protein [Timaviella obliquedivisa GSE-PSE-MK23-08B]
MQKGTLEHNILPKAKQRMVVAGLPEATLTGSLLPLTRDAISMEIGVINLADQSRVPGGRVRAGDYALECQFARATDRDTYITWFNQCKDGAKNDGVDPDYKRNVTIHYERLHEGTGTNEIKLMLKGCFPSKIEFPAYDMNADNGDEGDTKLKITVNYDDIIYG